MPATPPRILLALALVACHGPAVDDTGATTGEPSTTTGQVVTTTLTSGASTTRASDGTTTAATTTGATAATTSTSAATETSASESDTATTGVEPPSDEALLRRAIDGEIDPADAIQQIADSDGLPVITAEGTFLFACLCGPGSWRLAGDFNDWAPEAMTLASAGLWWIERPIAAPDGALYKFVDDQDSYIADPRARRYGFDDFGEFSLVRASAAHLERWFGLASGGLAPRDLQVFVPQGGDFTHVVYAHDGQNLFDPAAFWGGWKLAPAVPPAMMIVGVDNTAARFDEYTHVTDKINGSVAGGKAADYAALVHEVIRPRMEGAYGEPVRTAVMGSSLGGLVSLAIADLYPDAYDMVISLSATAGWGSIDPGYHNPTIIELYAAAGKRPFAIYLDTGGGDGGLACVDSDLDGVDDDDDQASDNYCENLQLRDALISGGHSEGVDLWYVWDPDAPHNEAAWASRVGVPLATFAGL